jgi:hypothetical protein
MAFIPYKNDRGAAPSFVFMPAAAGTYAVGKALTVSSGRVTVASGGVKPEWIAMENKTVDSAGQPLYCQVVEPNQSYRTRAAGAVTVGARYTISSDGMGVTTTTASGVAEVLEAGDGQCVVRFS